MKKTLAEVRAELWGNTVAMLRDIVCKDSTVKGVSSMRKAELVEAAVKVVAKLNPEVVEQPVDAQTLKSNAMKAVKDLQTAAAIEEVLMMCTKAEMLKVLSENTNGTKTATLSTAKAELAQRIAYQILKSRDEEKFRALTLDEKYKYLTSQTDKSEVDKVFWWLTEAESFEIARRVGIDPEARFAVSDTLLKLRGIADANMVESLADAGDVEGVKDALTHKVRTAGVRILCERNGLDTGEELDVDSPATREALIRHYFGAREDITAEYNTMAGGLMQKTVAELRAEIRALCEADDITGYKFDGYKSWPKAELVSELTDWYLFNSPEADDGLTSVYYEKEAPKQDEPVQVEDAVSEAVKVVKSDASFDEKYAALLKCTDAEMLEVLSAGTGGTSKLGEDYRSHEDLAGKVLCRIEQRRRELKMPPKVKPHDELMSMTLPALRRYVRSLIASKVVDDRKFRGYTTVSWGKDEIVRELDLVRCHQEASDAYYRHRDEEDAYRAKYATRRVRFEEGATYECASGRYTVVKRLSTWVKVSKGGIERSLPFIRVDVIDGVEVLEVKSGVILSAEAVTEASSIEVGSVFPVCSRAELRDASDGNVQMDGKGQLGSGVRGGDESVAV